MAKPYDATTKHLLETFPADWVEWIGLKGTSFKVIDADVSTVTAGADKVILVEGLYRFLVHFELQANREKHMDQRLLKYNVLLSDRHRLPVRTVVVLLWQKEDMAELTGLLQQSFPGEPPYLEFRYQVIRLWEQPVESLLQGGLGLLPLAPLSDVNRASLPGVVHRVNDRLSKSAVDQPQRNNLWTATYILMGLRFPKDFVAQII